MTKEPCEKTLIIIEGDANDADYVTAISVLDKENAEKAISFLSEHRDEIFDTDFRENDDSLLSQLEDEFSISIPTEPLWNEYPHHITDIQIFRVSEEITI